MRYLLNYSRAVVHLQADLSRIPAPKDVSPFFVRMVNPDNPIDLNHWINIVNDAYDDTLQDIGYAVQHFRNHLFLDISKAFFVIDDKVPIATISIGIYKSNPNIGGVARIAVKKKFRGYGLGSFLINYGFNQLYQQGINYGESIISITREQSILLHLKSGFIPQINKVYFSFKNQKRSAIILFLVNRKLNRLYKQYLLKFSENFLIQQNH